MLLVVSVTETMPTEPLVRMIFTPTTPTDSSTRKLFVAKANWPFRTSSSTMFKEAFARPSVAPPLGLESASSTVSLPSRMRSLTSRTLNRRLVTPGPKVSVAFVAR